MTGPPNLIRIVELWVQKAEHDLKSAEHLLKLEPDCPSDVICYLSQQSVEKYLKAILIANGLSYPKTHDLTELFESLPPDLKPYFQLVDLAELTPYCVEGRYPGDWDPITIDESSRAVRIALQVQETFRKILFPL